MPYKDPDKQKAFVANWQRDNRHRRRQSSRKYYWNNREQSQKRTRDFRRLNWIKVRLTEKKSRKKRIEVIKAGCKRIYHRRMLDPNYRLVCNLRNRIRTAIRKNIKSARSRTLIGCDVNNLKIYIETKFEPGMSWENYGIKAGQWSIDHIIPCSLFDLSNPDHQRACFHFSNLQPMWHIENIRKGNKLIIKGMR